MERGRILPRDWSPYKRLVLIFGPQLLPALFRACFFDNNASYLRLIQRSDYYWQSIKLYERNIFHYLKAFLVPKGQCKEGCKQMKEAMRILDLLGSLQSK